MSRAIHLSLAIAVIVASAGSSAAQTESTSAARDSTTMALAVPPVPFSPPTSLARPSQSVLPLVVLSEACLAGASGIAYAKNGGYVVGSINSLLAGSMTGAGGPDSHGAEWVAALGFAGVAAANFIQTGHHASSGQIALTSFLGSNAAIFVAAAYSKVASGRW